MSKLQLSENLLYELEKNLVLCYTGKSRLSRDIHRKVVDAYLGQEPNTRAAIRNLKQITLQMKNALLNNELNTFGELLNENWQNQKALHPSVANPQIDELFDLVIGNGAIGGKACGAGGGGCLVFYSEPDKEHIVRQKLQEAGVQVMDFNFDFSGLQIWAV